MNMMNTMKRSFLLFCLLGKRLYKKVSFLLILLSVVVITAVMCMAVSQESSMLRVALVNGESSAIGDRLTETPSIVQYKFYSYEEAMYLLSIGKIDAVWNFCGDRLGDRLEENEETPLVEVTIREQNVFMNLTLERLLAEMYPAISREFYHDFVGDRVGHFQGDSLENREYLDQLYDGIDRSIQLVRFSYYNTSDSVEDTNYLVTPLRGLLALIVMLCALACTLYYMHDQDTGHMETVPLNRRWGLLCLYNFAGTFHMSLFMLIALLVSGLAVFMGTELLVLLLYGFACVGFSTLVGEIMGETRRMAPVVPILMMLMLGACPIFINSNLPIISWAFPPYWYLNCVYNLSLLPYMLLYIGILFGLSFGISRLRR